MGAIGEYVHLTSKGYNDYGIYRWGHGKKSNIKVNFTFEKNAEMTKIKNKLQDPGNLQELEDDLNGFFSRSRNEELTNTDEDIQKAVLVQMQKQFKKLGNLNFGKGTMENSQYLKDTSMSKLKQLGENAKKAYDLQTIKNKIDKLESVRRKLAENLQKGDFEKGNELQSQLTYLKSEFKKLEQSLLNTPEAQVLNSKDYIDKQKNFITSLNKVIYDYAGLPPYSLIKGEFFEYLVPYIIGTVQGKAVTTLTQQMDNIKVGNKQNEKINFNHEAFSLYSEETKEYNEIEFDKDILAVENKPVQGKIDIFIDLNGKKIGASLKNYSLTKKYQKIHTVSNSSLLYFLQDIAPEFVNHYLNLNVRHSKSKKGKALNMQKERKESQGAMKAILSAKALTGSNYNRSSSDILIVNDSTKGKVKIFSMKNLVDKMAKAKRSDSSFNVNFNETSMLSYPLFKNESLDKNDISGTQRISKLINDLHSIKLSASIDRSFLQI